MPSRNVVARSGVWSAVLQISRFGLNALVFLILARWLSLEEIGAFAVAFAPIQILQNTQRGGFSETIVQHIEDDHEFSCTVFWMSAGVGVVASIGIFGLSGWMEVIFGSPQAGAFLAMLSPVPLLVGLSAVPEGILRRRMEMRALALRTSTSLTLAGVVAIWMGAEGYGGWALVAFALVNAGAAMSLVFILANFRPTLRPRMALARAALAPLTYISGRVLVGIASLPILQLFVGYALGTEGAGAFQIAQRFLGLTTSLAMEPIRFAILPYFAQIRENASALTRALPKAIGIACFLMVPVLFGFLAISRDLLPLVVGGANGAAALPALQALLIVGGANSVFSIYMQALTATGEARLAFKWSVRSLALRTATTLATMWISVTAVALSYSAAAYIMVPFLLAAIARSYGVPPKVLWLALLRPTAVGVVMALVVFAVGVALDQSPVALRLAAQFLIGVAVYCGLSLVFNKDQIVTAWRLVSALRDRRAAG